MIIDHKNKVLTHLTSAIDDNDEFIKIDAGDYASVLGGSGDLFLIIRGPDDREIIKVKPAESIWGTYLKVERGQGGSLATAWPAGSRIFASTTANAYNAFLQKAQNRVIAYNPNLVLTPAYSGEKVYEIRSGYERWWKSWNGINPYWDLITGAEGIGENYVDIGWNYDILISSFGQVTLVGLPSDGFVRSLDFTWAIARSATEGTALGDDTSDEVVISAYEQSTYSIHRAFYYFDLSLLGMTDIASASLELWRANYTGPGAVRICVQGGSDLPPVALGHFNSGSGGLLSNNVHDLDFSVQPQNKVFDFNSTGLQFIEDTVASVPGQILALVIREYDHDFLNVAPTGVRFGNLNTADGAFSTVWPRITIQGS